MTLRESADGWTPEQIAQCNYDMASGIIAEIREVLDTYGCIHGKDHEGTPPMFYPELVRCAIVSARYAMAKEAEALIEKHLPDSEVRARLLAGLGLQETGGTK